MQYRQPVRCSLLLIVFCAVSLSPGAATAAADRGQCAEGGDPPTAERVGDRLWLWAHPAGVYNDSFLADLGRKSTIEPVEAARFMGLQNVFFIHYDGEPRPPLGEYFEPFKEMDKVVWSLTGASGATSAELREEVLRLAADNPNVTGFVLDDFFHAPATGTPSADHAQWLAGNDVAFPVILTLAPPAPATCDGLELVQSDWRTGDYRTKAFEVEVSADGSAWQVAEKGELPNKPGVAVKVPLPSDEKFAALRVRILSTHDTAGARSCGLTRVRLFEGGQELDAREWKAEASSTYPGHPAANLLPTRHGKPPRPPPFDASLTTEQLRGLRERATARGKRLPINAVVYTGQISPRAASHLAEVDEISLWTWAPADLEHLEANLSALEALAPGKPVVLGCYLFDFSANKPLPVEQMKRQTELGYRWLREGRVKAMIFLASPVCDLELEAVKWTRRWIAETSDRPLERVPRRAQEGKGE